MEINEALARFESKRDGKYSLKDREFIYAVATELNLSDFEIKERNDVLTKKGEPYTIYIYDSKEIAHFHPEMIIAKYKFEGHDPKEKSKYGPWPYLHRLKGWTSNSYPSRPQCPNCFIPIPPTDICGQCELDLADID